MMPSLLRRLAALRRLGRDLRGVIALMTALLVPTFLIMVALIVDVGFWLINSARLQIAADAAAMVAGTMMLTSAYQGQTSAAQITNAINVASLGAQLGANQLTGTITPTVTIDGPNYTTVTVGLSMPTFTVFGNAVGITAPTLKATATATIAPKSCVLALAASGASTGITVGTGGTLTGTNNCPIFSDGVITNSGTLSGYTIGAVGTITNSGTMTPSTTSPGRPSQTDYLAGTPAPPFPASCTYLNNIPTTVPASTTASPVTFCGTANVQNGTYTFGGGIYYISPASQWNTPSSTPSYIAFDGSTVKFSAPTTFVLLGVNTTLYFYDGATVPSNAALTAPTSGPTAGFTVWQPCNSSQTTSTTSGPQFGGGILSTTALTLSGAIYAPCNQVTVNRATVAPASGSGLAIVANTISVSGANASLTAVATKAILTTPVLVN
jgi:Flp pilus assembly protein TadG